MSDFGQIEIYNKIFSYIDHTKIRVRYSPFECIENNKSYSFIHKKNEIPIMIGSNFHIHDENPINDEVVGYFIIDGTCKTINNIKIKQKINHFYNKSKINKDKDRIKINSMFNMTCNDKKWNIPLNANEMLKYSANKEKLANHLQFLDKSSKPETEENLAILCYMFDCWLGTRKPIFKWRLMTAGEIIEKSIKDKVNIIKSMRSNLWPIFKYTKIHVISEDMNHYNITGDIESIRKITIISKREKANMEKRKVQDDDKYKICPVQTTDGARCGTITYLTKNAKVTDTIVDKVEKIKGEKFLYINNKFEGKGDIKNKELYDIIEEDHFIYVYNYYGKVIEGNSITSIAASKIPYRLNNPPVRCMFTCSMLKQAIMPFQFNYLFNGKYLLSNQEDICLEVGIMTWKKYNIEDAIVISEEAVKKYEYRKVKTYKDCGKVVISVCVKKGQKVEKGILLYKIFDPHKTKTVVCVYAEDKGVVTTIKKNDEYISITIEKISIPVIGDKMTSMHGQKGVISLIEKHMPYYYKDGRKIYLELLINPHAFPTRMTYGQIKEMGEREEKVYVDDKVYNIIVGKCRYMTLRHQVDDKVQFRNKGKIDKITKQPVAGKKVGGGIRFGQMEREILMALGAKNTLRELWETDKIKIWICPKSGIIEPKCNCKMLIESHKFLTICLGYMRALGYDIKLFPDNTYTIDDKPPPFEETKEFEFGDLNPLDIRVNEGMIVLPICLRSKKLNLHYKSRNKDKIRKEIINLLKSKKGVFHTLFEGHRVNNCIRSVITPNPNLDLDEVEIPIGANIQSKYGLLNRQPSLDIDSIKLVKLKQSNKNVISINPLLCKAFNADFDGDEMNIYGIKNIEEMKKVSIMKPEPTQDYILKDDSITANKEGILKMIETKSKGKMLNYNHIYDKIGDVALNGKIVGKIESCYQNGLNEEEWYLSCKAARESTASIAVNTPITGYLESLCNQAYL